MAQPMQHYPPRAFSPQQNAGSPQSPYPPGQPAAKRPRLSPNEQSPYGSPNMANLSLPNQVFSGPYYGGQTNGNTPGQNYRMNQHFTPSGAYNPHPTYNSLNTQAPQQSPSAPTNNAQPNSMGPPGRPDNRPVDLNETFDVLFGAGVDLREEEAALTRQKENNQNSSFEDQLREASGANSNAQYPFARGNFYSQNYPGGRDSFFGGGNLNQPPQKLHTAEELEEADRKRKLRKQAEIKQYHLNKPFLQAECLRQKIYKQAGNLHVSVPVPDSEVLKPHQPINRQSITVRGPDNNDVVKVVSGEPLLGLKNSLVDILTLVSLATEERLRTLTEDAATMAKGRRIGALGLVPQDLVDLAAKKPNGDAVATLPTPENSAVSPKESPLKRSYSEMNTLLTPTSANDPKPPSNSVAQALQKMARAERAAEEARLVKRKKRSEAADSSRAGSVSLGASEPGTPGTLPDVPLEMPKKSALKNAKKAPTDEQAFNASNNTTRMMLGLGGKGKKLSWMTGGKDNGPSNPYLQKAKPETKKADAAGPGSNLAKSRIFGNFREDGGDGLGIQMRDVVSVLEHDGKEKKALQRAYTRMEEKNIKQ